MFYESHLIVYTIYSKQRIKPLKHRLRIQKRLQTHLTEPRSADTVSPDYSYENLLHPNAHLSKTLVCVSKRVSVSRLF